MKFSWQKLTTPFGVLAPMADVTDRAYRHMVMHHSRARQPGSNLVAVWTEFVSADGLCSRGQQQLLRDLQYHENEHPIIAQIFGSNPSTMLQAASLVTKLGFDGIDINMGCPDTTINKQGAGACLIRNPQLAKEIIRAAQSGVDGKIPVSVKTRIGWSTDESETWIPAILETGIDALTIHARTRSEMSDYPPHWDTMQRIVEIARPYNIPVIANGGIMSWANGIDICNQTGADGYMVGKGTFGTPWFFDTNREKGSITVQERITAAIQHTQLYEQWIMTDYTPNTQSPCLVFGKTKIQTTESIRGKPFHIMRKNFRAYINGFDGAQEVRRELMDTTTPRDAIYVLEDALKNYQNR